MRKKALRQSDAYNWMLEAQKLTEKHGGFSSNDIRHMRGYQPFSIAARKLGYLQYYEGYFHWVSDSVTMVMAELIMHEHHIRLEARNKARAAIRREVDINDMTRESVTHPIKIEPTRLDRPAKKEKPKRRWWSWLFEPKPDADPFERFLDEVFRNGENPFALINQKLDLITENQLHLEKKLVALNKVLAELVGEEDAEE